MKTKIKSNLFDKKIDLQTAATYLGSGTEQTCETQFYTSDGNHFRSDYITTDDNGNVKSIETIEHCEP